MLPVGGEVLQAKVTGHKIDSNGNPIGKENPNPILDSWLYWVKFPDGSADAFAANIIAEFLYL
jgi:hypothetical protein